MPEFMRHRKIEANFAVLRPDTNDADEIMDSHHVQGYGECRPSLPPRRPLGYAEPNTYVSVPGPVPFRVSNGVLVVEVTGDDEEDVIVQPLYLPVTVDSRADRSWAWQMVFHELTQGLTGEPLGIDTLTFEVPDGDGPLQLVGHATMGAVSVIATSQGVYSLFRDGRPVDVATDGDGTYVVGSPA